jgi:hypothetical protein
MASAIQGPNCIDEKICHGDCCHIHIDIPRILANYYIEHNLAIKENFIRGEIFSFNWQFDLKILNVFFMDNN